MRSSIFAAILLAGSTASFGAQAPGAAPFDLNSKLINSPDSNWTIYGDGQTNKRLEKDGPKGYPAYEVDVTKVGKNPWDAGAVSVVPKPVHAGDVILVAVYLRAPQLAAGATEELPLVGATGATAPYVAVAGAPAKLTNQWQVFFASGTAPQDFPENGVQATVHLASNKHVIELGPVKVYDFGPGFDLRRLPHN
jgi:hypothetical protein